MWSTGYSAQGVVDLASTATTSCGGVEREPMGLPVLDTLLGPEETDPSAPKRQAAWLGGTGLGCFFWIAGPVASRARACETRLTRLFFENYTVDASISDGS